MSKSRKITEEVRCPKCQWKPAEDTEWTCLECGYEWNMFETGARCPRCDHQHEFTFCFEWLGGCGESSPHLDWYPQIDKGLAELNIRKLFN